MATGGYEETEILIRHSNLALAHLEAAANQFRDDGEIMTMLNSAEGKKLRKFADEYVTAQRTNMKLPPISKDLDMFREKVSMKMIIPIKMIDYVVNWCRLSSFQLQSITRTSREFDIRWNLPVTLSAAKLFSAYCRVVLYLHKITAALFCVHILSSSTLTASMHLLCRFDDLLTFVKDCQADPFVFIANHLSFMKLKFSQLVLSLLPFYSMLFADWTIFDWSALSVFETNPQDTIGLSMPNDQYILLENISLFQEVLMLFALVFPAFMRENQQFSLLSTAVLTESPVFYLSRNYPIHVSKLLELSGHPDIEQINQATLRKSKETHPNRVKRLASLSEDICNLAGMDLSRFCQCIHMTRAVTAFAHYEIDMFFRIRDKSIWVGENIKLMSCLISSVVEIFRVFVDQRDDIQRFFLFNLATADATYLSSLLGRFGDSLGSAGGDIVETAKVICDSLLTDISLEDYDNGVRYDFLPLMLTHGRALHKHNELSQRLRVMFLNPVFEALMTINMHAAAASDAVRYFLDSAPIHTLWRHCYRFEEFVDNTDSEIDSCASFFQLFSAFNYDKVALSMQPQEIARIKDILENKVRVKLSSRLIAIMNQVLAHKASEKNKKNTATQSSLDYLVKDAKFIRVLSTANNSISKLPKSVNIFSYQIKIADYFVNRLSKGIIQVLLYNTLTNISAVQEASQMLWTLFSQARTLSLTSDDPIGHVFTRALFDEMMSNSFFAGTFASQTQIFLNKQPSSSGHTVVSQIVKRTQDFITSQHFKTRYVHFIQKFVGDSNFSYDYFRSLFRLLGPHAALTLDFHITNSIVEDICAIYASYFTIIASGKDIKLGISSLPESVKAADALLRISVSLAVRSMVLRALETVIESSAKGLSQYLNASSLSISNSELVLAEVLRGRTSYDLLARMAEEKVNGGNNVGARQFFLFLALLFDNPNWRDMEYFKEEDALSKNLHLLPLAFELFTAIIPKVFKDAKREEMDGGLKTFFNTLADVVNEKKGKKKEYDAFVILVDKIPKYVQSLEYGRMKHVFPYSLLAWSYPNSDE